MAITFIEQLSQFGPLSETAHKAITQRLTTQLRRRREPLLTIGQTNRHLYFIDAGLARSYYLKDGTDVTEYFAFEGQLIGATDSFFAQRPSRKGIEAVENGQLTALHHRDLDELYQLFPELERIGRLLVTQAFVDLQTYLENQQFSTAEERYHDLITRRPALLQRVPLKHVASYLGITPVSLSRIRSTVR